MFLIRDTLRRRVRCKEIFARDRYNKVPRNKVKALDAFCRHDARNGRMWSWKLDYTLLSATKVYKLVTMYVGKFHYIIVGHHLHAKRISP